MNISCLLNNTFGKGKNIIIKILDARYVCFKHREKIAVQIAAALLPMSVCAADMEISDDEKVSAILADSHPGTAAAPTIKFSNDNIVVNGSLTIDSSDITPEQAEYIVHAYGRTIDLGQRTHINSEIALTW